MLSALPKAFPVPHFWEEIPLANLSALDVPVPPSPPQMLMRTGSLFLEAEDGEPMVEPQGEESTAEELLREIWWLLRQIILHLTTNIHQFIRKNPYLAPPPLKPVPSEDQSRRPSRADPSKSAARAARTPRAPAESQGCSICGSKRSGAASSPLLCTRPSLYQSLEDDSSSPRGCPCGFCISHDFATSSNTCNPSSPPGSLHHFSPAFSPLGSASYPASPRRLQPILHNRTRY